LTKRQSTLTQLEFVSSPHNTTGDEQSNFSDADDEEYMESSRPNKRQKRYGKQRGPRQSTLTQAYRNWRELQEAEDSQGSDADDVPVVIEESEVEDVQEVEDMRKTTRSGLKRGRDEAAAEVSEGVDDSGYITFQAPSSEQRPRKLSQEQASLLTHKVEDVASAPSTQQSKSLMPTVFSDHERHSTRPTTAESAAVSRLRTPKKILRTEVPSSQTPSSITLSTHDHVRDEILERSPLKERSCNISPIKYLAEASPEEKYASISDGNSGVDMDKISLKQPYFGKIHSPRWTAKLTVTPRKEGTRRQRSLKRVTTIQDSEEGSLDSLEAISPSKTANTAQPSRPNPQTERNGGSQSQASTKSTRTLKRVTTIQESESEPDLDDLTLQPMDEEITHRPQDPDTLSGANDCQNMKRQEDYEENGDEANSTWYGTYQQNTYDPVTAALDRDAARYGKTDTQLQAETQLVNFSDVEHFSGEDDDPEEMDVVAGSDLDEPCAKKDLEPQVIESSQPVEQSVIKSSQEAEEDMFADLPEVVDLPARSSGNVIRLSGRDGNQQVDETATSLGPEHDLSTQIGAPATQSGRRRTQMRPSQVSTVMPTQYSRPNSAHRLPLDTSHESYPQSPEAFSSSPVPMPPWTSSQMPALRGAYETQNSLMDFSIPPPPPFPPSPSRQDTESSSL
jgi:hypothetical protein